MNQSFCYAVACIPHFYYLYSYVAGIAVAAAVVVVGVQLVASAAALFVVVRLDCIHSYGLSQQLYHSIN